MPIEQDLLDILVCPESRQPLTRAEPALLARLNDEIREALVREDGKFLYVVDDDIPIMLIDQSIELH